MILTETTKQLDIAFDFDGVLADFFGDFYRELEKKCGIHIDPLKVKSHDMRVYNKRIMQKDIEDVLKKCYKRTSTHIIAPGATELLSKLWCLTGDPIQVVTARPVSCYSYTHKLMEDICGSIPFVLIATNTGSKIPYLRNKKYFVEDRRKNALELARQGKFIYLLDKTYNRENCSHLHILRIYSLEELIPITHRFVKEI